MLGRQMVLGALDSAHIDLNLVGGSSRTPIRHDTQHTPGAGFLT